MFTDYRHLGIMARECTCSSKHRVHGRNACLRLGKPLGALVRLVPCLLVQFMCARCLAACCASAALLTLWHSCSIIAERQAAKAAGHAKQSILQVNSERFMVPEALFHPSDIGVDQAGVCETIANAVNACHPVFRPLLTRNVIVAGGTSACPGFRDRVESGLRPLLCSDHDMAVSQAADPASMAWHGASIFAAGPEYRQIALTRADYQELGAHRGVVAMQA